MPEVTINDQVVKLKQTKITRRETEFGHSYWLDDDEGYVAGVTTLLEMGMPTEQGLIEWYKRTDPDNIELAFEGGKIRGSNVHQAIERLLNGEPVPAESLELDREKKAVAAFLDWYRTWMPQNARSEQVVAYLDGDTRFAGTLDLTCVLPHPTKSAFGDFATIIDFKTSLVKTKKHLLQVAAYEAALEQSTDLNIEKKYVLYLGTTHKVAGRKKNDLGLPTSGPGWCVEESTYELKDFMLVYDMAMMVNGGYPEPPTVVAYPEVFKLGDVISNNEGEENDSTISK